MLQALPKHDGKWMKYDIQVKANSSNLLVGISIIQSYYHFPVLCFIFSFPINSKYMEMKIVEYIIIKYILHFNETSIYFFGSSHLIFSVLYKRFWK